MNIHLTSKRAGFGVRAVVAAAALALLAAPALAADPVFPIGSKLGIVPPTDMVESRNFVGFEDPQKNAAILLTTLPAQAYAALDKAMQPDAMKGDTVDIDKREPTQFSAGKGFLVIGTQTINKTRYRKWLLVTAADKLTAIVTVQAPDQDAVYTDKLVRDTLATLAIRDSIPDAEQLSTLPFKVGDMAGFHIEEILPGHAVMLIDKPAAADSAPSADQVKSQSKDSGDQSKDTAALNARLLIVAAPGAPEAAGDRDVFARTAFQQIVGIKDVQVQDAEPLRILGQQGYETLAKAKDLQTDTDIMVVQWLRFGTTGYLQMVGISRADSWLPIFARLRTVRDSIDTK
jgi:hypothetical protein